MSNRKCCHERLILLFGSDQIIRRSLSSQLTDNFVVVSLSKMIKQDDCAPIYRFQHASFALLCAIYLPYVFHTNIWTLYTQPWPKENCTEFDNRTSCCPCQEHRNDANLFSSCRIWWDKIHGFDQRKVNVIEEVKWNSSKFDYFLFLCLSVEFVLWRKFTFFDSHWNFNVSHQRISRRHSLRIARRSFWKKIHFIDVSLHSRRKKKFDSNSCFGNNSFRFSYLDR